MQLGDLMLIVTLIVTVGAIAAYIGAAISSREELTSLGRMAYLAATAAVVAISAYFMWLILANRYDVAYVFNNSSKDLALMYKISVFWAGQQGSFLFWALCSGLLGVWVMVKSREFEPWMMAFWSTGQLLFLVLLLIDSPFKALDPQTLSQVTDGAGLRELLQNPWMAIHPPLVFIGYAAMCVPAAFAVAGLISGNTKSWVKTTLPWAIFGWITLGLGIILGSYWAYEVLGWGGYWGWDPVENASLIPWLTGTALLHGMIAERARGAFKRTNVGLALVTFLFVFYATFLTRSNALEGFSVHTFGDAKIGQPLLIFMGVFLAFSLGLSAFRWKKIGGTPSFSSIFSKDYVFFLAIVMFVLCATVVLVGTSVPIFAKIAAHGGQVKQQAGVDASFYNKVGTPIALVIFALMALAPIAPWRKGSGSETQQGIGVIIAAVLIGIPFVAPKLHLSSSAAGVFMALVAVASLAGLIINAVVLGRTSKHGIRLIGSYAAHVGMGMMFVGVVTSAFGGPSRAVVLPQGGKPVEAFGYKLSYEGTREFSEKKSGLRIKIERGGRVTHAMPIMQLTRDEQMLASPHIVKTLGRDLYIAPKSIPGSEQKQMSRGQTLAVQDFEVKFEKFIVPEGHGSGDMRIGSQLSIRRDGKTEKVTPFLVAVQSHKSAGVAVPAAGMGAKIGIDGIRVESKTVDITLTPDGGAPVSASLEKGSTVKVGDYTLTFREWYFPTGNHAEHMQVGATIKVARGGRTATVQPVYQPSDAGEDSVSSEPVMIPFASTTVALSNVDVNTGEALLTFTPTVPTAVVDVSVKPFISLLWVGAALALIGGAIAMWRRTGEAAAGSE